jgi:hypothetical protein
MIVNTDAGTRPLQGDPIVFKEMIKGGRNMQGFGAFPNFAAYPNRFMAMSYAGYGDDTSDTGYVDANGMPITEEEYKQLNAEADAESKGTPIMDTINKLLASGAQLGTAYAQYAAKNKPTVPVIKPVVSASSFPSWVWIVGGVVIVGGGAYLLLRKRV